MTSTTTFQTRKEICTRLILVFFYQKQYNSLIAFVNHSMWRLSFHGGNAEWYQWYLKRFDFDSKVQSRSPFLKCTWHPHVVVCSKFFSVHRVLVSRFEGHYKLLFPPVIVFGQIKQRLQMRSERQDVWGMESFSMSQKKKQSVVFITQLIPLLEINTNTKR